jgi:hypothetical protein
MRSWTTQSRDNGKAHTATTIRCRIVCDQPFGWRLIEYEYKITTAPHDINVHGAQSGGLNSLLASAGVDMNNEAVCCADFGLSLASTAFSITKHSAPRMHSTIPSARKMDRHIPESLHTLKA